MKYDNSFSLPSLAQENTATDESTAWLCSTHRYVSAAFEIMKLCFGVFFTLSRSLSQRSAWGLCNGHTLAGIRLFQTLKDFLLHRPKKILGQGWTKMQIDR